MATADLGPIVGTKELRPTTLVDDCLQHSCYALARHARIGLKCKTFAREGVHHTENTQTSPACCHIAGEINRPFLVRLCQDERRNITACQSLAPDAPDAEPGAAVHALDPFMVDPLARTAQQNMKPPISEAGLLVR